MFLVVVDAGGGSGGNYTLNQTILEKFLNVNNE